MKPAFARWWPFRSAGKVADVSIDDRQMREQAEREIGEIAAELTRRLELGEVTAREMILACRRILDIWCDGERCSIDDEVIGILGIESQCDHVMLRPGWRKPRFPAYEDEDSEIERLGEFFREPFIGEMRELAERFGGSPGRVQRNSGRMKE